MSVLTPERKKRRPGTRMSRSRAAAELEAQKLPKLKEQMKIPASLVFDPEDPTKLRCETKGGKFLSLPRDPQVVLKELRRLENLAMHAKERLTFIGKLCVSAYLVTEDVFPDLIAGIFAINPHNFDFYMRAFGSCTTEELSKIKKGTELTELYRKKRGK